MRTKLTERQAAVYQWTRQFFLEHHRLPHFREVAAAFGFSSPNAVTGNFRAMVKKGWMARSTCGGWKFTGRLQLVDEITDPSQV